MVDPELKTSTKPLVFTIVFYVHVILLFYSSSNEPSFHGFFLCFVLVCSTKYNNVNLLLFFTHKYLIVVVVDLIKPPTWQLDRLRIILNYRCGCFTGSKHTKLKVCPWFCYLFVLRPWHIKIPIRHKMIHGMSHIGCKEWLIDLKIFW